MEKRTNYRKKLVAHFSLSVLKCSITGTGIDNYIKINFFKNGDGSTLVTVCVSMCVAILQLEFRNCL